MKKERLRMIEEFVYLLEFGRSRDVAFQLAQVLKYRVKEEMGMVSLDRRGDRLAHFYFSEDALIDNLLHEGWAVLQPVLRRFRVVYWVPGTREQASCEVCASRCEMARYVFQLHPSGCDIVEIVEVSIP